MSNMTVNQRNQFDRATYSGNTEGIRRNSQRGALIYSLFAALIAAVLCVAAASIMDGWWQFVIMGAIAATAVGLMIAVSPTRRG